MATSPTLSNQSPESGHQSSIQFNHPWVWLSPALALLFLYGIFPLVYNIYISFHRFRNSTKEFVYSGWFNWDRLIHDDRFWNSLEVTFKYVILALIIQILLGAIIALLLDAGPWGAGLMQSLMILPMVTAPAVAGMLFRLLEHSEFGAISWFLYETGILDPNEPLIGGTGKFALVGVVLVDIWQWTPFIVLILLAGLKGLPTEILEAAEVDGANFWQRLFRIKLPLMRNVLIVAIMFRLIDLYRVFDYILILTSGGPGGKTESVSFYGYVNTFTQTRWGYGAAIGLVILAIAWVTIFLYQRLFRVEW